MGVAELEKDRDGDQLILGVSDGVVETGVSQKVPVNSSSHMHPYVGSAGVGSRHVP